MSTFFGFKKSQHFNQIEAQIDSEPFYRNGLKVPAERLRTIALLSQAIGCVRGFGLPIIDLIEVYL